MGNLWLKIKVWTKVLVFFALLLYAILFIYQNSTRLVKPWFWFGHGETETSVLILGLCAFLAGVVGTILTRTTFKTVRQIRQLKDRTRSDRLQREVEEMKMKAAKLRSRPAAGGRRSPLWNPTSRRRSSTSTPTGASCRRGETCLAPTDHVARFLTHLPQFPRSSFHPPRPSHFLTFACFPIACELDREGQFRWPVAAKKESK